VVPFGGGTGPTNLARGAVHFIPAFDSNVDVAESAVDQAMPGAGTISSLYVRLSAAPGAGTSYAFFVRRNGVDTALTCTVSGTAMGCSDLVNSVAFSAGDLISVRSAPTSNPAARTMRWTATFAP
jgi:hypothetical protein